VPHRLKEGFYRKEIKEIMDLEALLDSGWRRGQGHRKFDFASPALSGGA